MSLPAAAGKAHPVSVAPTWQEVCQRFKDKHGRLPRALHITNIANNAYHNAKILSAHGLEGDVLCPDYYHIMGCPEWEDADFRGDVDDHFAPRWNRLDLNGFQRPRWFAQGPIPLCLQYLEARRRDDAARADDFWRLLGLCNATHPGTASRRPLDMLRIVAAGLDRYLWAALCPQVVGNKVERILRGRGRRSTAHQALSRSVGRIAASVSRTLLRTFLLLPVGGALRKRATRLIADFNAEFPDRGDPLSLEDFWYYSRAYDSWRRVLQCYDLIIGYGIGPINALVADGRYFAMEHGTLRQIPFEDNAMGRLTALGYRRAEHVFVTNLDCLPQAESLAGDRVTFINHPFDEDHGLDTGGAGDLRAELCARLDAEFLCFFPTRQDWVADTGFADKGNDEFFRAFATLRAEGRRIGLVCCRWGSNVAESEDLLRELGCDGNVAWCEPMGMVRFERNASSCDLVVDQFRLGAFGGVVFKSLALGVPVCTYLDVAQVQRSFPQPPPVVNCRDVEAICAALRKFMSDPDALADVAYESREWMKRHHASDQTVERQLEQFTPFLASWLQSHEPVLPAEAVSRRGQSG